MSFGISRHLMRLAAIPGGKDFLRHGGRHLAGQSLIGAGITGGLTTLSTGNPLAGLVVGGADLIGSTALARGLGSKRVNQYLQKNVHPKINLAGRFAQSVDPKTGRLLPTMYNPSLAQMGGMGVASVGSTLAIEPQFYPQATTQGQQYGIQEDGFLKLIGPRTGMRY